MAKSLNIRNVDPELLKSLKSSAFVQGVTLRDYCMAELWLAVQKKQTVEEPRAAYEAAPTAGGEYWGIYRTYGDGEFTGECLGRGATISQAWNDFNDHYGDSEFTPKPLPEPSSKIRTMAMYELSK